MNGTGNDFIIINNIEERIPVEQLGKIAKHLCMRRFSIGADGFIAVMASKDENTDFEMLFFNADGSMGEMCGNGARCVCRYGYENGLSGGRNIQRVKTSAGLIIGERLNKKEYRILMNNPSIINDNYIELGNPGLPHVVIKYSGIKKYIDSNEFTYNNIMSNKENDKSLYRLAAVVRWSPSYPKGTNVNFYDIVKEKSENGKIEEVIYLKTFERGVEDFTLACGTGSTATAYIIDIARRNANAVKNDKSDESDGISEVRRYKIVQQGGILKVEIVRDADREKIFLSGETTLVCEGRTRDDAIFV